MKTDIISRLASIFLAVLFMSNDLVASVHTMVTQPLFKQSNQVNQPMVPMMPVLGTEGVGRALEVQQSAPQQANDPIAAQPNLSGYQAEPINVLADHSLAVLGVHEDDKMGNPSDDVFTLNIAEPIAYYDYAVLHYHVKGVANGHQLPKTINGLSTYGAVDLIDGDQWQTVEQQIGVADLTTGNNNIVFALPQSAQLAVEVKDVSLTLTNQPPVADRATKLVRLEANPVFFSVKAEQLQEGMHSYALRDYEMVSIPKSIANVTMGANGYRLQTGGAEQEPVQIEMAVDPAKMLGTSNLKEVQLFFFNANTKRWESIMPEHVDMTTLKVEATVPGNNDYFAGMIKTPEMPEAAAYMPTAISDIEAANPAAGMNLMSPPEVSHTGEASIHYPLDIPQGRQGMTPQLALTYNSDAGTGWMGMGWNISIPQVSIDTRWGVPEFNSSIETEVYSLNGQSLTMEGGIKANRIDESGAIQNTRKEEARFFEKVMKGYKEIHRVGNSPSNYCWIETMANGTRNYYGTTDGSTVNSAYVLKNGSNIVIWYLAKVVDKWGNSIDYTYQKTTNSGNNELKNGGVTVTPDKIYYTGIDGESYGKYNVEFVFNHTGRQDATVSAKLGVKVLDDAQLEAIKVNYQTNEIKRFELEYNTGDFFKEKLIAIKEYRSNSLFYQHDLEYYTGAIDYGEKETLEFDHSGASVLDNLPDELFGILGPLQLTLPNSPIKTTSTYGWGVGGSVGVGIAPGTVPLPMKSFTFSGRYGYSETYSRDRISLNDVNGDGIPDVIYDKLVKGLGFQPITRNSTTGNLLVGGRKNIHHSGRLFKNNSSTHSYGFDFAMPLNIVYYGRNWNNSKSEVGTYLTDYNADGIKDIVIPATSSRPSVIKFGQINSKNELSFGSSSTSTYNTVKKGSVPSTIDDTEQLKDIEIVRSWRAPFTGEIEILGNVETISNINAKIQVAVQQNSSFIIYPITINSSGSYPVGAVTHVDEGDLILFRIFSDLDGQEDFVKWNPRIEYQHTPKIDVNGINYSQSTYSDGFLLSAPEPVAFDGESNFKVVLNDAISGTNLDDVVLQIKVDVYDVNHVFLRTETWEKEILHGNSNSGSFVPKDSQGPASFIGAFNPMPGVEPDDICYMTFEVFSTSNVKWKNFLWRPEFHFSTDCEQADKIVYPVVNYQTYNRLHKFDGVNLVSGVQPAHDHKVELTFSGSALSNFNKIFVAGETGIYKAYLVVKSGSGLLGKAAVNFKQNPPGVSLTYVSADGNNTSSITDEFRGDEIVDDQLYVEIFAENYRVGLS